jgi:thymidine kinase
MSKVLPFNPRGMLTVVTGCMFSGKSTEMGRRLVRSAIGKKPYLLFKPALDNRYAPNKASTHDGGGLDAIVINEKLPVELLTHIRPNIRVIGIDEVQFFRNDVVAVVNELLDRQYDVICAGLSRDFKGDLFGAMDQLLYMADEIASLKAVCSICGEENATMTQRFVNGKPASRHSEQILVGSTEAYEARCKKHHQLSD